MILHFYPPVVEHQPKPSLRINYIAIVLKSFRCQATWNNLCTPNKRKKNKQKDTWRSDNLS